MEFGRRPELCQINERLYILTCIRALRSGARNQQSGKRNREIDSLFDYEQVLQKFSA